MVPREWLRGILNGLQLASTVGLAVVAKAWPPTWPGLLAAVICLAFVGLLCQLGIQFVGRRRAVQRFLERLHVRSWMKADGRDPDYRVAFFVGELGKLKCYYRTDGHACPRKWSKKPPQGRDGDGVVGYIWQYGLDPNVRALTLGASDEEVKEYQRQTHVSAETYKSLSWPGAAIRGVPVEVSAAEGPVGVLLVERRTPGSEIELDAKFRHDATVCGLVWKGWL